MFVQVLPLGEGKTQVLMDYYVHPSKASPPSDFPFIWCPTLTVPFKRVCPIYQCLCPSIHVC